MIYKCFIGIVYLVFRDENVDIRVQLPHVAQEHCQLKIAKTGEVMFFCFHDIGGPNLGQTGQN